MPFRNWRARVAGVVQRLVSASVSESLARRAWFRRVCRDTPLRRSADRARSRLRADRSSARGTRPGYRIQAGSDVSVERVHRVGLLASQRWLAFLRPRCSRGWEPRCSICPTRPAARRKDGGEGDRRAVLLVAAA